MENPVIEKVQSITTREPQIIVLDGLDAQKLKQAGVYCRRRGLHGDPQSP